MRRVFLFAILLALGACVGSSPGPEGDWRVVELDGTEIEAADGVTLTLDDGQASGRAGCNRFAGSYAVDPGFAFGPLALTRMACFGRAAELETLFTTVSGQIDGFQRDGDALVLTAGNRPVLRAVPADPR